MELGDIGLVAFGAIGGIAGVVAGVRWLAERFVGQAFAKRLEEHKHQLAMVAENQRLHHALFLREFDLYVQKKHRVYEELFDLVMKADGHVMTFHGLSFRPTMDDWNDEDFAEFLKSRPYSDGKKQELCQIWQRDRADAKRALAAYDTPIRIQEAQAAVTAAKNLRWSSAIFLSDEVGTLANSLFSKQNSFLITCHLVQEGMPLGEAHRDKSSLVEKMRADLTALEAAMKRDLRGLGAVPTPEAIARP